MKVVTCAVPSGTLEPAPLTSLPVESIVGNTGISAFWGGDDYYLCAEMDGAEQWYRIDVDAVGTVESTLEERVAIAAMMADITPLGGGRVAFPVGSSGRRFYRVWRSGKTATSGRTRILAVRAARSRRQPA